MASILLANPAREICPTFARHTLERMAPVDPLRNLGVHLGSRGGEIRVWSGSATAIELCIFDGKDPGWVSKTIPLSRDAHDVWSATTRSLSPGTYYALRASGPSGP